MVIFTSVVGRLPLEVELGVISRVGTADVTPAVVSGTELLKECGDCIVVER